MDSNTQIRHWQPSERPREKLLRDGHRSLTDTELLAIIIGSGTSGLNVVDLARQMLAHFDHDLSRLMQCQPAELLSFPGIGQVRASTILASLEFGRRLDRPTGTEKPKLNKSAAAFDCIAPELSNLVNEEFWVLYLSQSNRLISKDRHSIGGISSSIVDVRLILRRGISLSCSALILAHNHPSGNRNPSEADRRLTSQIMEAAKIMGIQVLDHIIVAGDGYFSFADEGLMPA